MKRATTRGLLFAGWLLTPVAAWAVSFLGGWLGALFGIGGTGDSGALGMLATGAVLGAVAGAVAWVLAMKVLTKYFVSQSNPGGSQ